MKILKALKDLDLEMPISLRKIKKNYKKLVKIFHPDVNGNNKKAEEKFKQINESYKLLLKKFIKKMENKPNKLINTKETFGVKV